MEEDEMAALKTAKKQLRALMHKTMSQVPEASIAEQSRAITARLQSLPKYMTANCIGVYLSMPKGEITTRAIVLDAISQGKHVFVPYIYQLPLKDANEKSRKAMEMVSIHSREDYEGIESNRDAWGIPSVEDESVSGRNFVVDETARTAQTVKNRELSSKMPAKQTGFEKFDLDLIVMPGVAFDRKCGRLGHGKGFYDTFLQRYHDDRMRMREADEGHAVHSPPKMPFLVGLALNEQVMPDGQEVPKGSSDWCLDALITGDGNLVERPGIVDSGQVAGLS